MGIDLGPFVRPVAPEPFRRDYYAGADYIKGEANEPQAMNRLPAGKKNPAFRKKF